MSSLSTYVTHFFIFVLLKIYSDLFFKKDVMFEKYSVKNKNTSKPHSSFILKNNLSVATEGVKYSGSKLKLLPYILSVIDSLPVRHVLDGFSGTTRVSQALAKCGYRVTSNDRAVWSKVFGECYLKGKVSSRLQEKIKYLNSLKGKKDWFTKHYGGRTNKGIALESDGKKKDMANS